MDKILNLDSVDQYNSLYGLETLNPLVSVIDLNKATRQMDYVHWNYGVYALYLKLEKACDIKYGRRSYDYQEGTVVCFAPGQTTETTLTTDRVQLNVLGILFHPDLLRGTTLGKTIKKYTFFSYEVSEALHLSEDERNIMTEQLKLKLNDSKATRWGALVIVALPIPTAIAPEETKITCSPRFCKSESTLQSCSTLL